MEQREHMLPISKVLLNFKNRNHDIQVEAEQLMHEYQRDIFGLNETRLQRDINDHEVCIEGFQIHCYSYLN